MPSSDAPSPPIENGSSHPATKSRSLSDPSSIYEGLELNDVLKQTRIFTLEPGAWKDPIRCTLVVVSLLKLTVYEAISYPWGETAGESDRPSKETILVNEKEFEISANLASALRHLRVSHTGSPLWADAISHNQSNNTEMNKQVGLMRMIYQKCAAVRIWLGKESPLTHQAARPPPDDESPRCVWNYYNSSSSDRKRSLDRSDDEDEQDTKRVKLFNRHFYDFYNLPKALQHNGTQDFRMGLFCFLCVLARVDHLNSKDLPFLDNLSCRDGIFAALKEMMQRQWWSRQWVIQETVLAKVATVHYGRFMIP